MMIHYQSQCAMRRKQQHSKQMYLAASGCHTDIYQPTYITQNTEVDCRTNRTQQCPSTTTTTVTFLSQHNAIRNLGSIYVYKEKQINGYFDP